MGKVRAIQLALVTASLFLTACGLLGGTPGPTLGDQTQLQPQTEAVLTCSQECADRGWCGMTSDQTPVIFGNTLNPMDPVHDRLFYQDTPVSIFQSSTATIETVVDGERSQLPFYQVISLDQGKSGWVAGWCITAPPASE